MGRQASHSYTLPTGQRVGYSLTDRDGGYRVRFVDPAGKRVERATGCDRKGDARQAAEFVITSTYAPKDERPAVATWDEALADLEATDDLRPDSVRDYRTAVTALRKLYPDLSGPAAVTPAVAHAFPNQCLRATYKRGRASDAAAYKRSPTSVNSYLRSLKALWGRKHWGRPGGFVAANVWADVPPLNAPRGKRVRVPTEDAVTAFFAWLEKRHPGWALPRLFVTVKMLAGCRTLDLCQSRTTDLGRDALTLTAEATKAREARTVPLPADVLAELRRVVGPTYLWERAAAESRKHRPGTKDGHANGYRPSSWRHTVQNLFREFNRTRSAGGRLRPHDLRARAITLVAAATQSVDATAQAMGVDPQTARHYLDAKKAFDGSAVLRAAQDALRGSRSQ
jgi:hypothetical protein